MKRLDDIFTDKVMKRGRNFVTNLSILLKMTEIYDSANEALNSAASRFLAEMKALIGNEEELSIRMADESFFIEDIRVRTMVADLDTFGYLIRVLSERGVGTLTFRSSLGIEDIIHIAYSIKKGKDLQEVQSAIDEKFVSVGGQIFAQKEGSIDFKDTRLIARRAYARAVSSLDDLYGSINSGKALNIKKSKRAVQSMVDCILKDEGYMLFLTTKRDFEKYHLHHPVNVALISMAVGKKIGFNKYQLSRLGMSALFHDMGMAGVPEELLDKKGALSDEEKNLIMEHPEDGVRYLLRARGLSEVFLLSMLASFEHHINLDLTGYPHSDRTPNIYNRIMRVADEYENLTSGKSYGRRPVSEKAALAEILKNSGVFYDPPIVSAFISLFAGSA